MRLGDLDALKEKLSGENYQTYTHEYGYAIPTEWVMNAIDNAPTVEPCYQTTSCLDCKNYDKETHNCPRYCEVIKEAINSRPTGEWAFDEKGNFYCDQCKKYPHDQYATTNFCPNCGACMQKGSAE